MPSTEPNTPNLTRINAQIHTALTAALNNESPPPRYATTATSSTNGTDLPRSANGPGQQPRQPRAPRSRQGHARRSRPRGVAVPAGSGHPLAPPAE